MTTVEDLEKANKSYPKEKMYKLSAAPNLTFPGFCSGNRNNMWCTHIEHSINLIESDSPLCSTSFEKPYGKYTDSYKVADADFRVIAVIPKFMSIARFNYIYIVQNVLTKVFDIIEMNHYAALSEDRGYLRPYTDGDLFKAGDFIKKGTTLYRSNNHDEFGNYKYGRNVKVAYMSVPEVEEDGIVIRKGACSMFDFYDIQKIPITLNKNQILLNLYSSKDNEYKCFPDIGEKVKDGIIYARRSINYANAAAELTDNALRHIVSDDEVCHGEGYVADIDIWVNDEEEFIDAGNKAQIFNYYQQLKMFYTKVYQSLDGIVNAKKTANVQYTSKLRYLYEHARNYLDTNNQWQNNNNSFEFAYIVITTYNRKTVGEGYKLTDRFGGKGVISHVWPDEYMPRDEYGNVADLIISPPGMVARANPGQNYEQEYNFIACEYFKRLMKIQDINIRCTKLIEFINDINPEEAKVTYQVLSKKNDIQKHEFFNEMQDSMNKHNGIIIVHEPFAGTIRLDNIEYLYKKYKIEPSYVYSCREFKNTTTALPLLNQMEVPVIKSKSFEFIDTENAKTGNLRDIDLNQSNSGVTPFDIKDNDSKYTDLNVDVMPDLNKKGSYIAIQHNQKVIDEKAAEPGSCVGAYINSEGYLVRKYKSMNKIVIGCKYYILLKQMPDEKFSARSIGSTNQIGIPNKPGKQNKLMSPYAKSAIKLSEMDMDHNFIRVDEEIVHRLMATHSTNPELREKLETMLLTEDPYKLHDLPIKNEDIKDDVTALMFHSTMYSIGIEIEPEYED